MTVLPRQILQPIESKLQRLRREARLWHLANGSAWLAVVTLAVMLFDLGADRLFRLDLPQRVLMLLLMCGVVSAVAWYKLIRPLGARLTDDALCLQVEKQNANLNQSVISALQLARLDDAESLGLSPQLLQSAVASGVAAAESVDFAQVIDRRARTRRLGVTAAVIITVFGLVTFFPETAELYLARNFAFAAEQWPQQTQLVILDIENGELVAPRGDDAVFRVRAEGVVPSSVLMEINPTGARRYTRKMTGAAPGQFEVLIRNVLEPMKIRARGGDDRTEWVPVRLVERPGVEQLTLTVLPPAYTGLPRHDLPPAQGTYDVLAGSTLLITGQASPDSRRATLLDENRPLAAIALDAEQFQFTVEPDQLHSGSYGIELIDTNDLKSRRPVRFSVRVLSDTPPAVRARLEGISDLITQRATVPIVYRFTDDHAVTAAELSYRDPNIEIAANQPIPQIKQPITAMESELGTPEIGPAVLRWEIEPLQLPPGTHITFQVLATDNNAFDGPGIGRSGQFALKVVSDEELRGELLRREQEQRMEFERLLSDQKALIVSVRAFAAGIGNTASLSDAQHNQLKELEKQQRLAAGRCRAIADHFRQTLAEIDNNKLEEIGGPMHRRMAGHIIEPLEALADRRVPEAADHLDAASRPSFEAGQRQIETERALQVQRQIVDTMTDILTNMVKVEGYHEAINLMRRILKEQSEVNEKTRKALEEQIEDIFDD